MASDGSTPPSLARLLAWCRYVLLLPVIGCVIAAAGAVVVATGRMFSGGRDLFSGGEITEKVAKATSLLIIEVIDLFLIGTVAYITAVGLYKLFISDAEVTVLRRIRIETVKDLEDKIFGVLVAALAIAFLGHAAADEPAAELLSYGAGIALVIASLAFFIRQTQKPKP